jgi:sugar/nucleoside kinase (ribokinase family)
VVVALGYASADRTVAISGVPGPDETAIVRRRLSRPWPRLGGCGPQIAAHLARAGVAAAALTWVADDAHGRLLRAELEAAGADTGGVVVDGTRTAESFIAYDPAGRSLCFFDPGDAGAELSAQQRELVVRADTVVLTVAPAAATRAALAAAGDARVVWSVKADRDAYPPELVRVLLQRADVIALAEGERGLLDGADPRADALVLVTHGAEGVRWRRGGESGSVPVEPVATADTTGAGDAFVAGTLARLMEAPEDVAGAVAAGVRASRALLAARTNEEPTR